MTAATRRPVLSVRSLVAIFGLALLMGSCTGAADPEGTANPSDGLVLGDPGDCVTVDMAVSSEKIDLMTDLARDFNAASVAGEEPERFTVDGECIFVRPATKASGAAAELLATEWDTEVEGPRPVVWSPASSAWGQLVNYRLEQAGRPTIVGESEPFMLSPLVIAMPEPMAAAVGYPDTPIGWADILELAASDEGWGAYGHPEWGPFKLGKTNPHFSTSGLSALIAQNYAAVGTTADLSAEQIAADDVTEFAATIETAVTHYGDTTLTYLNNLYRNDVRGSALSYTSAVAVEEVSVINYNRGNPDGVLSAGEVPEEPRVPLVAIYPTEGTLFSDNPYIVLDADWVDADQAAAAEVFGAYLQQPMNQQRVLEFGFRPGNPSVAVAAPVSAELGVDPDQPQTTLQTPEPSVLAAVLDQWDAVRKAARVLLTVDVSGSMGDPVRNAAGEEVTKLDLAKSAAITALDQFRADDEVGLRIFSSELGDAGDAEYLDVVEIAPMVEVRQELATALESLVPMKGTPLYAAVAASYLDLYENHDDGKINAVVVLSDGQDDGRGLSLNEALAALETGAEGATVREVRVFPIGYGDGADMGTLNRLAEATDAVAYDASDPASIDKVFTAVVSNF